MSAEIASVREERPPEGGVPPSPGLRLEPASDRWEFQEGDAIAHGLHAVRLLGGGSRYEAYLAWADNLHCLVVTKVLRPRSVTSAAARVGLAREAHLLDRLQHPCLLRCFRSVLEGSRPHLVLEFLEGPRLSTLLRRFGALAPEQLAPLSLQLCSALHYLRAQEMLHLDVKPQNIIMGPVPRLIDLSIARSFEEGRSLEHPVGTDAYMAPEQCEPAKAGGVGPEADIW
jgi:serine/threonine protein kinase